MFLSSHQPLQYPDFDGVRHSYGSRVWGTIPGVFDRTGGHRHQNGAKIGRIWEFGSGKCPDSGCSELGTSHGPGRFFKGGSDAGRWK